MVECQLPKLDVAGSTPVSRSIFTDIQMPQFRTPLGSEGGYDHFLPLTAPKSLILLMAGFDVQLKQLELHDRELDQVA